MQLEEYLDISANGDAIRIKDQDIGLESLIQMYRLGFTAEDMRQEFPSLTFEQIYGALTYYLHNQSALDAYIARVEQQRSVVVSRPIAADEKIRRVIREHEHEWAEV